jgi:hypothetical protein
MEFIVYGTPPLYDNLPPRSASSDNVGLMCRIMLLRSVAFLNHVDLLRKSYLGI